MENSSERRRTRVAFDIGGVIVDKKSRGIGSEAVSSVRLAGEKFGAENVFIVSKARDKWKVANQNLLARCQFCCNTGMLTENVHFVDEWVRFFFIACGSSVFSHASNRQCV